MKEKPDQNSADWKYLVSKGWYLHEHKWSDNRVTYAFVHPVLCPTGGGYTDIENALSSQREKDNHDQGKCWYYASRDNHGSGYGYIIREFSPQKKRRMVFSCDTKSVAIKKRDSLNKKGKCEVVKIDEKTQYNFLLILKEKYGNHHFHVPTLSSLFKTCRKIIMERISEKYWYDYLYDEEDRSNGYYDAPQFSKEEIEKWKDSPIKKLAQEQWKIHDDRLKYKQEVKNQKETLEFIKKNDNLQGGMEAYHFLRERKDGEYEGVEFISFKSV